MSPRNNTALAVGAAVAFTAVVWLPRIDWPYLVIGAGNAVILALIVSCGRWGLPAEQRGLFPAVHYAGALAVLAVVSLFLDNLIWLGSGVIMLGIWIPSVGKPRTPEVAR